MSEEKKPSLFRKKSEEYINSPEKLDHYLHVTSPGVWILLLAVIILLVGACIWGVLGRLETHVSLAVVSDQGKGAAYVPESAVNAVVKSQTARIEGQSITLEPNALEPMTVTDSTNVYVRQAGGLKVGDIVYEIPIKENLESLGLTNSVYSATVTTETISPISLLLN